MKIPVRLSITERGVAALGLSAALHTGVLERLGLRPEHSDGQWIFVAPPEASPIVLRVLVELIEDEGYDALVSEPTSNSPGPPLRPSPPKITFEEMYEDAVAEMVATARQRRS